MNLLYVILMYMNAIKILIFLFERRFLVSTGHWLQTVTCRLQRVLFSQ